MRTQDHMISWGHYHIDMAACAAPIYSQATQQVIAILSVSCPLSTYTEEQFKTEIAQDVMQHANQISKFIYL